jgi:riboflavin transporter FmnP
MALSRARQITAVALFAAMAVVLNQPQFSVPAPYAPFLNYEVWEVPIAMSFLLFGGFTGVAVVLLNTGVLELYNPGALPTGPIYNMIAVLSMMAGVLLVNRTYRGKGFAIAALLGTGLAVVARVGVMTVVNWLALPQPYPIGFNVPPAGVPSLLVLIAVFNGTVALYTVPLAHAGARAVMARFRSSPSLRGSAPAT